MATVAKVVTNTLNQAIFLTDVEGFNASPVEIPALAASLDLSTLADPDQLANSYNLAYLVSKGILTVGSSFNTSALAPGASAPPSGAAGGGLSGTYPNPTVHTNANLTGDVTSVGNASTVAFVGGSSAANVHTAQAAVALGVGITHTFTTITSITVTDGIVTAISGS